MPFSLGSVLVVYAIHIHKERHSSLNYAHIQKEVITMHISKKEFLISRTKLLISRTKLLISRTKLLISRTKFLISRTKLLISKTKLLISKTKLLISTIDFEWKPMVTFY